MIECSDSVLRTATSDPKINGRRLFVFIIGGMTRSEVSHLLTRSCSNTPSTDHTERPAMPRKASGNASWRSGDHVFNLIEAKKCCHIC